MFADPFSNPYLTDAVMVTTFFSIAWGFIFKDMLEYQVARWYSNRKTQPTIEFRTPNIVVAYVGLCVWLFLFSTVCMRYIAFSWSISLAVAGAMVVSTGLLIWIQMGSMMQLLVEGGSAAMSIDEPALDSEPIDIEQR